MKRPIEAIIEDVVIDPEKIQPIIVNFHNGHLKDEETKRMKCGLYYDEKKKKKVLAMSNGQIVYKGYRPDHSKEPTYTMLAIHNKLTNKVRLIQVERWDVAPVLDQHVDNSNDDDIDKIATLNKQFGSKKIKRRTEQYERMKINVENVKETLEKTVSQVQIDRADLEPESKDEFVSGMLLPPCNRDATDVSDIYCVDDIVPKNILKTLYSQAVEIAEGDIGDKPSFFEKTVEKVKNDPKSAVKIATLLYIESVMNWLNTQLKLGRKNDLVVCPYSVEVNAYVLETYSVSTPNGRCRPNTMKDKGLIHCIILGLIIWNYTLDLELFSTMVVGRLGIKKLTDLAKLICATPLKDKKSVILKLPLPNPPAKVMTKRTKINK